MTTMIRYATEQDLAGIVEIANQAIRSRCATGYLTQFSVAERKEWFTDHTVERYPILVADQHDRIIGYASIDPYRKGRKAFEKTGEISVFIHQEYHRMGIGNQLLNAMIKTAKNLGYTTLIAIVLEKNHASRKHLEKNFFQPWGFLPNIAQIDGTIQGHVYYGKTL
jgi:L-amino acid N-acyltransferase YncA